MIRFAVCDDDRTDLKKMEEMLEQLQKEEKRSWEVAAYSDAKQLIRDVKEGNSPDVYMLDVLMPEIGGIELAREIRSKDRNPSIIYLTSSPDYALEAYGVHAVRYLIKPIAANEFKEAVDAAIENSRLRKGDRNFCMKTPGGRRCFAHHNILYAECYRRMVMLHTVDGEAVTSVCIRNSFEQELEDLLMAENFLQTHKSYVVNMDYIESFRQGELTLTSGDMVRISKNRQGEVKKRVLKYLADRNR